MNRVPIRRATVKATSLPIKLRYSFNRTQSVAVPDVLTWFEVMGYTVLLEPNIVSGKYQARCSYTEVVLPNRLHDALRRINPTIPFEAIAAAMCQVTCTSSSDLLENNRRFHKLLTDGVEVEYFFNHQTVRDKVWLIDPYNLLNNDWLVIHPVTIIEKSHTHCPDIVVFVNGIPLAVIVCIHPRDQTAGITVAIERFQTYLQQIPTLFSYNAFLVISCGNRARIGTLTSQRQEFLPWYTIDGEDFPLKDATELEVLIQGIFDKRRFLNLVQHFIVFEDAGSMSKKLLRRPFCTIQNRN